MEKAIRELSQKYPELTEHIHRDWELVKEYPLSNEMLSMSRVFRSRQNQYLIISAKGSPETILDLCHTEKQEMHRLLLQVNAMAENGLRVIGGPAPGLITADCRINSTLLILNYSVFWRFTIPSGTPLPMTYANVIMPG